MRIDRLVVKNFKGFADREFDFHPRFNLIVGVNGSGKTSLLDALSVAAGSWLLGISGYDTRHIRHSEVLLKLFGEKPPERQYPCDVAATGEIYGKPLTWLRSLNTLGGRTRYKEATNIKNLATKTNETVRSGCDIILPLISYYGTGRLWNVPREQAQVKNEKKIARKEKLSRLEGYHGGIDPRLPVAELVSWIARQSWIAFQKDGLPTPLFKAVQKAIICCLDGAKQVYFDADMGEIIVEISGQKIQPFNNLSDGQQCMLAMVGDIAQRAAKLNPHLEDKVLEETPGVVLIDELDLHLHPQWQRRVIDDLRRTFPKIQFFATTHAPQLIGQAKADEIILLDLKENKRPCQSYGMDSNWILRNIMDAPARDKETEQRLNAVYDRTDDDDLPKARKLLNLLEKDVGLFPELQEIKSLIDRLEMLATDEAD